MEQRRVIDCSKLDYDVLRHAIVIAVRHCEKCIQESKETKADHCLVYWQEEMLKYMAASIALREAKIID